MFSRLGSHQKLDSLTNVAFASNEDAFKSLVVHFKTHHLQLVLLFLELELFDRFRLDWCRGLWFDDFDSLWWFFVFIGNVNDGWNIFCQAQR